jgi:hypothetical protein
VAQVESIPLAKKKSVKKKVGAVKIVQKDKNEKVTKVLKQIRAKKTGQFKGYKQIAGVKRKKVSGRTGTAHKDSKSHNVNIRVVSGVPNYKDPEMASEIQLYADSDSKLYFSRKLPILKNLEKKFKKGTYNIELASKLWLYYIQDAMQGYNREFGSRGDKWSDLLNVADRKLLAREYAIDTLNEFQMGNFIVQ